MKRNYKIIEEENEMLLENDRFIGYGHKNKEIILLDAVDLYWVNFYTYLKVEQLCSFGEQSIIGDVEIVIGDIK